MSLEVSARVARRDVDLSFSVETGETVAVLGPNGAGKSTALSVVAGLLRPDEGRVVLGGRTLTDIGAGRAAVDVPPHRRGIALLAQEALLFPHLSVLDNVAFGPRCAGASRRESREVAVRWLELVEMGPYLDRRPGQLSGGQSQRVAVARALAADPGMLLLDEPMAALDVGVRLMLRHLLRTLLAERTTLIVTHDVLDALLLADRVLVVEDGSIVEEGRSADVLARPRSAFAARLAGLNLVDGRWEDGVVRLDDGSALRGQVAGPEPAPGDPVLAVFRPTAVSVYREPPHGSPRNVLDATVTYVEPRGDLIRIRSDALSADVTPQAAAELALVIGDRVAFSVKATEVSVYVR